MLVYASMPMKTRMTPGLIFAVIVVASAANTSAQLPAASSAPNPRVERLLAQISEQRIVGVLEKLGSFGTRSTLSSADSPTRGIGAARQWILDEMKRSSPRLQVAFEVHGTFRPSTSRSSPGTIGSDAAATTRPSTSRGMPRCA